MIRDKLTYGIMRKDYESLLEKLKSADEVNKRQIIIDIGERGHQEDYNILKSYIKSNHKHQALIAMSKLDYNSTIDIIIGLLKKEVNENKKNIQTLECIFIDRLDSLGEKVFLEKLDYFKSLDINIKKDIYNAIKNGIRFTIINDYSDYLINVKSSLGL